MHKLGKYTIDFDHYDNLISVCKVHNGDKTISTGKAHKAKNDNFNKSLGRKIALTRAIKMLPKDERTEIWNDYRNMTTPPRW